MLFHLLTGDVAFRLHRAPSFLTVKRNERETWRSHSLIKENLRRINRRRLSSLLSFFSSSLLSFLLLFFVIFPLA